MITTETTDAQSFAATLTLLNELLPTMHEPARRRAAWRVARGRADLAAAVAVEGYSLDAAPVPPPAPVAVNEIAELQRAAAIMARARLEGRATPAAASAINALAGERIHAAALEAMKRDPKLTYQAAVVAVTR